MKTKATGVQPSIVMLEHDIGKTSGMTAGDKVNRVLYAQREESVWSALGTNWRALLCSRWRSLQLFDAHELTSNHSYVHAL
jgi:hypothetical protein